MKHEEAQELTHDITCATCEKMFDCKGKPAGTKNCIGYVKRVPAANQKKGRFGYWNH